MKHPMKQGLFAKFYADYRAGRLPGDLAETLPSIWRLASLAPVVSGIINSSPGCDLPLQIGFRTNDK
jgi:hypothetical protein